MDILIHKFGAVNLSLISYAEFLRECPGAELDELCIVSSKEEATHLRLNFPTGRSPVILSGQDMARAIVILEWLDGAWLADRCISGEYVKA
jgi:hypothetical protein